MPGRFSFSIGVGFVALLAVSGCSARAAAPVTTVCGSSTTLPRALPPEGSGPVVLMAVPCLESPGGGERIPDKYRRYVELESSQPARGVWVPYDDQAKAMMQADYRRLWETGLLHDLAIRVTDYHFPNGVVGKFVAYTLQER